MKVALYQVIQDLKSSFKVENVQYEAIHRDGHGIPFFVVELPKLSTSNFCIGEKEFKLQNHHFTVFSEQSSKEGYLSAYHYTGIYKWENEEVLIRVYYNRNDTLCLKPQVWAYKTDTGEQLEKIKNFFMNDSDSILFETKVSNLLSPIIITLRTSQHNFTASLEKIYQILLKEMVALSKDQLGNVWQEDTKNAYLKNVDRCISILTKLRNYSNNPNVQTDLIALFTQYKISLDTQAPLPSNQDLDKSSPQQLFEEGEEDVARDVSEELVMDKPNPHPTTLQTTKMSIKRLIESDNLSLDQVKLLETELATLNTLFWKLKKASLDTQYELLSLILDIRGAISGFCATCICKGDIETATPYLQYTMSISSEVILALIEHDQSEAINSLLESGVLSLNTVVTVGETKQTIYEVAFFHERHNCIALFVKRGIPVVAMFSKLIENSFKSPQTIDMDNIHATLMKSLRVNNKLSQELPVSHWIIVIQNTTKFLSSMRKQFLSSLPENNKIQRRRKSNSREPSSPILLFDNIIEMLKLCEFIAPMFMSEFSNLLKFNNVINNTVLELAQNVEAKNLLAVNLDKISPVLPVLHQFLCLINTKLQRLSRTEYMTLSRLTLEFVQAATQLLSDMDIEEKEPSSNYNPLKWISTAWDLLQKKRTINLLLERGQKLFAFSQKTLELNEHELMALYNSGIEKLMSSYSIDNTAFPMLETLTSGLSQQLTNREAPPRNSLTEEEIGFEMGRSMANLLIAKGFFDAPPPNSSPPLESVDCKMQ